MRRAFAAVMMVAAALLALSATPALATAPSGAVATPEAQPAATVQPMITYPQCWQRSDFVELKYQYWNGYFWIQNTLCFADPGDAYMDRDGVISVCSGNNSIYFDWQENPGWANNRMYMGKFMCQDFSSTPGNTTVTHIHIN